MAIPDAELVRSATSGNEAAFDELVSRYRSRVYHLALSKVRTREAALDLAQDAFVQAFISLDRLRSPEKFASWLAGITNNLCLMHLRAAREVTMPDDAIDDLNHRSAHPAGDDMNASMVHEALSSLPTNTRIAALLFFVDGMKQVEIAEFLGISLAAVKSRIHDARMRLRKEMVDMVRQTGKKDKPGDRFNTDLKHRMELVRWYRDFADHISKGVSIIRTLDQIRSEDYSENIREATSELMDAIMNGATMSDALSHIPALNAPRSVGMVRAGEIGGILDWTAQYLADWMEIENAQKELELAFWCRTIASVIAAGAPVSKALECSFDFVRSNDLKRASRDLLGALESGKPLDAVLEKHSETLPPIVRVSILAGHRTNYLGYTLQWASNAVHARMSAKVFGREIQPPTPKSPWVREFASAASEFLRDPSDEISAAAATIVGRLGAREYAGKVLALLSDADDIEVRRAAVSALADMKHTGFQNVLTSCLHHPEASVRQTAIQSLTDLEIVSAGTEIARLLNDEDRNTADKAAASLESLGLVELLTTRAIELLGSDSAADRLRAVRILKNHPTPDAADALIDLLDDEVGHIAWTAAIVLSLSARKEAIPILVKALEDPNPNIWQPDAAKGLEIIGDPSTAVHIRSAVERGTLDARYISIAEELERHRK